MGICASPLTHTTQKSAKVRPSFRWYLYPFSMLELISNCCCVSKMHQKNAEGSNKYTIKSKFASRFQIGNNFEGTKMGFALKFLRPVHNI